MHVQTRNRVAMAARALRDAIETAHKHQEDPGLVDRLDSLHVALREATADYHPEVGP